jgi:hypothetical protein
VIIEALDTVAGEAAEKQIDAFIERRANREPDPDELEPSYAESVRRYHERQRKEVRALWYAYFCRLAESLRSRAAEYDRRAEALLEDRGEGGT